MSKVWFVTDGASGLGACRLTFYGLAALAIELKAATYGSHGSSLEAWRASGQDASNSSIAKKHS
jgi:hypothetical protein